MNKLLVSIAAVAILAVPSITMASDIYVAGQVNHSNLKVSDGTDAVKLNDTTGGGVGVGYNINNWLAVEGTYENLGKETFNSLSYTTRSFGAWVVVDPTIFTVANMPVKALARVGYTRTDIDANYISNLYSTRPAFGVGVAVGVAKNLDITAEYRFRDVRDDGVDVDIDTYLVGATYSF